MHTDTLDLTALRADFPILSREVNGHPSRLSRLRRDLAEAPAGARRGARRSPSATRPPCTGAPTPSPARPPSCSRTPAPASPGSSGLAATSSSGPRTPPRASTCSPTGCRTRPPGAGERRPSASGWAPGDEIVVTEAEHHANLVPWQELAARTGATLRVIGLTDDGLLRLDEAAEIIGAAHQGGRVRPRLQRARRDQPRRDPRRRWPTQVGALVVLDACQSGAAPAARPARARRRLRRVLRPQDARPDRDRRALRAQRRCSTRSRRSSPAAR